MCLPVEFEQQAGDISRGISVLGANILFARSQYTGAEMAGYGEQGQPAGQSARMPGEPASGESARRAWAKPVVRRFSLQKTLAGTGTFGDAGVFSQHTPT